MPTRETMERVRRDRRRGEAPTTQAGEFVREEIHHIREGRHGARSARQAIAIGLSKARRAGVGLKPPAAGQTSEATRRKAERDYARGHGAAPKRRVTARRRKATQRALERETRSSVTTGALAGQTGMAASRRTRAERSRSAKRASRTKGAAGRSAAARRATRTRSAHRGSGA
jgi:hypothetical protein